METFFFYQKLDMKIGRKRTIQTYLCFLLFLHGEMDRFDIINRMIDLDLVIILKGIKDGP